MFVWTQIFGVRCQVSHPGGKIKSHEDPNISNRADITCIVNPKPRWNPRSTNKQEASCPGVICVSLRVSVDL